MRKHTTAPLNKDVDRSYLTLDVPLVKARDGDVIRQLIEDIQLLDGDRVDLVEHIQRRNVRPVALDDVYELVLCCFVRDGIVVERDGSREENKRK